jgi:hypothetical protein
MPLGRGGDNALISHRSLIWTAEYPDSALSRRGGWSLGISAARPWHHGTMASWHRGTPAESVKVLTQPSQPCTRSAMICRVSFADSLD